MISIKQKGDFKKTSSFLNAMKKRKYLDALDQYGQMGVEALSKATPIDTGETAASWSYVVYENKNNVRIVWNNSNVVDGVSIAVVLQYGHATGNGGYVEGIDYINPAIRPIFDEIADTAWKEVKRS